MRMRTPSDFLKHYFGYSQFRPKQEEIIQNTLDGKDGLVLMPTGGGKSICFQIPALMMEGTAIVISPLIALMKDQVDGLVENGIPAALLNSSQSAEETEVVKTKMVEGKLKLLYVSPERFLGSLDFLMSYIKVSFVAIDEAHCISQWGHDFRPEYTQLWQIKERYPRIPIIALTATADKITRTDMAQQLRMNNPTVFITSFNRPNLALRVVSGATKRDKLKMISGFLAQHHGESGVIYCTKRDTTEEVARELRSKGFSAAAYHAGLSIQERERVQSAFINDSIEVICATVAFGMGIDKSNVRWVMHYNLPRSMEGYYQEIGRAGRDGMPAATILFYSIGDLILLRSFAEESGQKEINTMKLDRMRDYAESSICRRKILLSYFGETLEEDCGNCDVCNNPPERFNGSIIVQKALSAVIRAQTRIGINMLVLILRGSTSAELTSRGFHLLRTYGVGRDLSYHEWMAYLMQMLQLNVIELAYNEGNTIMITPFGEDVLYGRKEVQLFKPKPYEPPKEKGASGKRRLVKLSPDSSSTPTTVGGRIDDVQLFEQLKVLRKDIAIEKGIPAYLIFSDKALSEMAKERPVTRGDFEMISGVGAMKSEMYADRFTTFIKRLV